MSNRGHNIFQLVFGQQRNSRVFIFNIEIERYNYVQLNYIILHDTTEYNTNEESTDKTWYCNRSPGSVAPLP